MIILTKLNFQEDLKNILNKPNKTIRSLLKLQNNLPRVSLLAVFKSFAYYGDVIYDQSYNHTFHEKIKLIQQNAALAIASAISFCREKLYQELGMESIQLR